MQQPEEDRAFWDQEWAKRLADGMEDPDSSTFYNDIDRLNMEFLAPYMPAAGWAVEIGCGSARTLARVGRSRPLKLVGLDYALQSMRLVPATAHLFGVRIRPIQGDATCLPHPDGTFDVVISGGLLEHIDDPRRFLSEMVRVLKPGGLFFATVVPRKLMSMHRPLHRWLGPQVHRTRFGPKHYAGWLEELGCRKVITESRGVYPPLINRLPPGPRRFFQRLGRPFDGTRFADLVGFYFAVLGIRG